jgi:hypothetical protein
MNVMARLVRDDAAVLRERATPAILRVVILIAAPAHAHRAEHKLAETSGIQRFARLHDGHVEAVLLDDEQAHAMRHRFADHSIAV